MAWEYDKLGREKFGKHFAELLVERYESRKTFIVNLDAPWGQGKTFFLENLSEQLADDGYPVAYVNAWQDDRSQSPLVTVLAAIDAALAEVGGPAESTKAAMVTARRKLTPVIGEVAKQIGKHAVKLTTGVAVDGILDAMNAADDYRADEDAISSGVDAVAKRAFEDMEARLKAQEIERKAVIAFREKTADALRDGDLKLPLFVIVDELDRCRPTYAVQMLEELKHIFAIEGVVFVIGTDTVQLSHSVNALYGEKFDSARYLRRFFDRVVVFPPVDRKKFIASFSEGSFIDWESFSVMGGISPIEVFNTLFAGQDYSNRDIEQFFEIVDTFASSWDEDVKIEPIFLAALVDDYLHNPTQFPRVEHFIRVEDRRNRWSAMSHNGMVDLARTAEGMQSCAKQDLADYTHDWTNRDYFIEEYNRRVAGRQRLGAVPSLLLSYRQRIVLSARTVTE